MILTGKAKEGFENIYPLISRSEIYEHALIIEWFDSVGIYICIENHYRNFGYKIQDKGNVILYDHTFAIHSRQEATKQAISKASEIYNENKRKSK